MAFQKNHILFSPMHQFRIKPRTFNGDMNDIWYVALFLCENKLVINVKRLNLYSITFSSYPYLVGNNIPVVIWIRNNNINLFNNTWTKAHTDSQMLFKYTEIQFWHSSHNCIKVEFSRTHLVRISTLQNKLCLKETLSIWGFVRYSSYFKRYDISFWLGMKE